MRILLLSAYDAASHKRWREGVVAAFPEHQWQVLSLPPRHFNWRVRGNSLSWAFGERELLTEPCDLMIATSMVDLSALKGLVPALAKVPTLVYFHENQFAYPGSERQFSSVEPQVLNLYTALAADHVAFNSHYNRQSFLSGARRLLAKMPDCVPEGVVDQLAERCTVLPVPLSPNCYHQGTQKNTGEAPLILWAARWEYDKGPDRLLAIMRELEKRNSDYRMCILGQEFRHSPEAFNTIRQEFSSRLLHCGYEPSAEKYQQWLNRADIVLSTAIHEFQGLAVIEAIAAGCIPVLPGREVYPELVEEGLTYRSIIDDVDAEAYAAADLIERVGAQQLAPPDVSRFSWQTLRADYESLMEALAGEHPEKNTGSYPGE